MSPNECIFMNRACIFGYSLRYTSKTAGINRVVRIMKVIVFEPNTMNLNKKMSSTNNKMKAETAPEIASIWDSYGSTSSPQKFRLSRNSWLTESSLFFLKRSISISQPNKLTERLQAAEYQLSDI